MQTPYSPTGDRCRHATSGPTACNCQTCQIVKLTVEIACLKERIVELKAEVAGLRVREIGRDEDVESVTTMTDGAPIDYEAIKPNRFGHTPEIGGKDE